MNFRWPAKYTVLYSSAMTDSVHVASPQYTYKHTVEAKVPAAAVWATYEDVTSWPVWEPGTEKITRDGPLTVGASGTFKFTGKSPLTYWLTEVEPLRGFTDETTLGEVLVRVSHRLEPGEDGRLRITHAAEIFGPPELAAVVGPSITADFPQSMVALVAFAAANYS